MADIENRSQATFQVVPRDDGSFAVIVHILETSPTTITPFATEEAAHEWIEHYKRRVAEPSPRRRGMSR